MKREVKYPTARGTHWLDAGRFDLQPCFLQAVRGNDSAARELNKYVSHYRKINTDSLISMWSILTDTDMDSYISKAIF